MLLENLKSYIIIVITNSTTFLLTMTALEKILFPLVFDPHVQSKLEEVYSHSFFILTNITNSKFTNLNIFAIRSIFNVSYL